jgi:hypothetical protein
MPAAIHAEVDLVSGNTVVVKGFSFASWEVGNATQSPQHGDAHKNQHKKAEENKGCHFQIPISLPTRNEVQSQ